METSSGRGWSRRIGARCGLALAATLALGCAPKPTDWGDFDVLRQRAPRPRLLLGDHAVSAEDYGKFRRGGEIWFRSETFGNERTVTDVIGLLGGSVSVPSDPAQPEGPRRDVPVLGYFFQALDALDGVPGNLFSGNGAAYTSDLVVSFPAGTRLHGLPLPERLHTGLDVEAGSPWPIGIVAVPAPAADAELPYLIEPAKLGVGPAPPGRFRLGLTCATCHYSLDVDGDGKADLRSAWSDVSTPGSPYRPEHAWAIGNQDLHLGSLVALSKNPLSAFSVFSGVLGGHTAQEARAWGRRIKENYRREPERVLQEVVAGMLLQPRGFADDTPDGLFNAMQIPVLYTRRNWPYNYDGNFVNSGDRNNGVWTVALDITALVGLCDDRGGGLGKLAPDSKTIYNEFTAEELATLMVSASPAAIAHPEAAAALRADILGASDGVPGLLRADSIVLVPGLPGSIPESVRQHPANRSAGRNRSSASFGGDAGFRDAVLGYAGMRVTTTPEVRASFGVPELGRRYGLDGDEFLSESVSLMLDSLDPPPNRSALLARARPLVARGYELFKQEGCASCHRGPFFTDNVVHPLSEIGTQPSRAEFGRSLQLFLAPTYDPDTGKAIRGGFIDASGARRVGYKTVTLRFVWGSAPYLHDGGVGVATGPGSPPPGDDLAALLARPPETNLYGTAPILAFGEANPESHYRSNAALSLQALLLENERRRVIAGNGTPVFRVPGSTRMLTGKDFGIEGIGHEFWIRDKPGGEKVTALVAFLLALDDWPGRPPGP
jgi:hypothetical protein